jgi:hypothetical protein
MTEIQMTSASKKVARRLMIRWAGGVHEFGRLWIVIHDRGVLIAWEQIERWSWEC